MNTNDTISLWLKVYIEYYLNITRNLNHLIYTNKH